MLKQTKAHYKKNNLSILLRQIKPSTTEARQSIFAEAVRSLTQVLVGLCGHCVTWILMYRI